MAAGEYLIHQVVHLILGRTYLDNGVQQAGRSDDLFDNHAF